MQFPVSCRFFVTLAGLAGPLEKVNSKPSFTKDRSRVAMPLPSVSLCCRAPPPPGLHSVQEEGSGDQRLTVTIWFDVQEVSPGAQIWAEKGVTIL